DATVTGVMAARMRLGPPDVTGRQTPEPVPGSDYTEPCDLAIKALGFEPEEIVRLWDAEGLEVTRWGTVKADFRTHATSLPGVYAAGDIVRGASLVVWAIRDGCEAADAIEERLNGVAQVAAE
ncbi:MAG: FAD-dependent oxidoreductase, partial [Proteobacteria bacterium]|nr:FAD-dependent oxidoreductase [Pseudomonadota bacterium]